MLEDKLLIWKFKCGNRDALRRIYEKYKDDLLKLATALSGNTSTAEDVVHNVFVAFAQSADGLKLNGSLKSYLATCVANRVRNRFRDDQRHRTVGLAEARLISSESDRPDEWIICSEELKLLGIAMEKIPYEQREVIVLHLRGDISFRQIAKLQGASINTIQSRYRYGLNKLRSILNGEVLK